MDAANNVTANDKGKVFLLAAAALIVQLASNYLMPGLGILFLGLLLVPQIRTRTFAVVLGTGAAISLVYLAIAVIDGTVGPSIGYQFG